MSITTYLPTRLHRNATGPLVCNSAGRLVRGWAANSINAGAASKRFRIVDYTDGDVGTGSGCGNNPAGVCDALASPVWDGTFSIYQYADGVHYWRAFRGYIAIAGLKYYGPQVCLARSSQSEVARLWPDYWPPAVAALVGDAGASHLILRCYSTSEGGNVCSRWGGVQAQPQIGGGVDLWPGGMAGTYTRGPGYTVEPAQIAIEEY